MVFYERFTELCDQRGITPSRAARDIGLSRSTASAWKSGTYPTGTVLNRLASYFNVPVSYLTGEIDAFETFETKDPEIELFDLIEMLRDENVRGLLQRLRNRPQSDFRRINGILDLLDKEG